MMRVLGLSLLLAATPVLAEQPAKAPADEAAALAQALPDPLMKKLRKSSPVFIKDMAELIASFGDERGLTADGVAWMIASARAEGRARALGRFVRADLDGDGQVSDAEAQKLVALAMRGARGRHVMAFLDADSNGDRVISADEAAAAAAREALTAMSEEDAEFWKSTLLLDRNDDGFLRLDEVTAATELLQQAAAAAVDDGDGA